MKKLKILTILLICLCLLSGCNSIQTPIPEKKPITETPVEEKPILEEPTIGEQENPIENKDEETETREFANFNISFFDTMLKDEELAKENICISPFSFKQALLMVSAGTGYGTNSQKELLGIVNEDLSLSNEEVGQIQKKLYSKLQDNELIDFTISNMVLIDNDTPKAINFEKDFSKLLKDNYNALVEDSDLQDSKIVKKVNNFVNKSTKGTIPTIIKYPFESEVRAVFLNTIYFLGDWQSPFSGENTSKNIFYGLNGEKEVDMMYDTKYVSYFENEKIKSIVLPYKTKEDASNFEMILVLPKNEEDYIVDIYNSLNNDEKEEFFLANFEIKTDVAISLPKFKVENKYELIQKATEMGLKYSTSPNNKDFVNIVNHEKSNGIHISDIIQKTYIKVDEKGTEASAVTMIDTKENSVAFVDKEFFEFNANRPFIYFIREKNTNTVLFIGINNNIE